MKKADEQAAAVRGEGTGRVLWLDGVRGGAAVFVVLHHMWLNIWTGFPRITGPRWLGFLVYGHLAVAVFIVVSGFSLSLSPLRHNGRLSGGIRTFLRRRAWRIVPPYWAALVLSTLVTALFISPSHPASAWVRAFIVHGLLLQDIFGSIVPNGTFWSIAVEWQIYFAFPLILLLSRRAGFGVAALSTLAVVVLAHVAAGTGAPLNKINHLTIQFLALFAFGVLAARLGTGGSKSARMGLLSGAILSFAGIVTLMITEGSVWIVSEYFWVDLAFGACTACLVGAMYAGGATQIARLFASRPARRVGLFSYSLYLVHGPIISLICQHILLPAHLAPLVTFGILLGGGLPLILALAYGFHLMFEAPFLKARGAQGLLEIPGVRQLLSRAPSSSLPVNSDTL